MKIAINGGHFPGKDPGAVGASGLQEARVVKDIGNWVCGYLKTVGCETLFIQENELQDICDQSNQFSADLFVSIHCNSAGNKEAKGTEVFCLTEVSESGKMASCIQSQIVSSIGMVDRGVKTERFYVLRNTDCPAVLVECAFISNSEDEELLANAKGKDDFARAIARGISDHVAK